MARTNVKPKLSDIIPLYGCIDYVFRTTYDLWEKPSVGNRVIRGLLTSVQVCYNSFIGAELFNVLEGKPSFTRTLLEKILQ